MTQAETPYRIGTEINDNIVVTTGNEVQGCRIHRYLGIVRGIVVRSPSVSANFVGSLRAMSGGNIPEYTEVCEAARHEAYAQMLDHARAIGANAIIAMRYDATEFMKGVTEVLAYGTAVLVESV